MYNVIMKDNIKIYMIIILASLFVVLLGVKIYDSTKDRMIELSNKTKIITSHNIINTFGFWFDERINSLNRASKFIEYSKMLHDDDKISKFLEIFASNSPEFDLIQLLKDDEELYINGKKIAKDTNKSSRLGLIWYIETKQSEQPTVNFMSNHRLLNQDTLNFCVPNFDDNKFAAVLCGVVKIQSIFEKINSFELPANSYSFIITHSGEIITPMGDLKLKNSIENSLKELFLTNSDKTAINLGSNFIVLSEIKHLNWFVGAGTDNKKETAELIKDIGKKAAMMLFVFLGLAIIANLLHNYMYKRLNRKNEEYEILLAHKAKMGEAGELISGINHQFIQPVNSLNLMISTLLMLKNDGKLNDQILIDMLKSGEKSVVLLNDTIKIFRNFYTTNESKAEFSIKQSIKNLLTLMHTELSRANVSVCLNDFDDKNVIQIENIIQQILLILIHNAKDALNEHFKDDIKSRKIFIDVSFNENICFIYISDFGGGVSEEIKQIMFTKPKTTKKHGSGIGLYFAKKLAKEKLDGDLILLNRVNPTKFELNFKTKENND
ncbi:sensor histidine kinase [Campylobacter mucosalis]|uniref:sensor histidine kinase n=1 Tax=Campylobacter mucosalis TaxID=202 RepID=UPI00146FED39|nr:ATP-binding protein [Campylobacter mucosalis]